MATPPWDGWSIIEFWRSVQDHELLRIQFQPAEPQFTGKVFVLLDRQSASATEMAADALRASGVATLIGETTAGEMLSQSFFDVADGFTISLPVADYYSLAHGRIEGAGVPVDIEAVDAMAVARELAREQSR
jgi:C-terminal processing protease CtpA/Prc